MKRNILFVLALFAFTELYPQNAIGALFASHEEKGDKQAYHFSYSEAITSYESALENDKENDGIIDEWYTYAFINTYDSNNNLIKVEWDWKNDGSTDSIWFYTYDTQNNMIKEEKDSMNNGTIGYVGTYEYDADGNKTKEERDQGNDGVIDEVNYFTYDIHGNLIKSESDWDNDGIIDLVSTCTYKLIDVNAASKQSSGKKPLNLTRQTKMMTSEFVPSQVESLLRP